MSKIIFGEQITLDSYLGSDMLRQTDRQTDRQNSLLRWIMSFFFKTVFKRYNRLLNNMA